VEQAKSQSDVFLGVGISDPIKIKISKALGSDVPGRQIPQENWHLTLFFMGLVEGDKLDHLTGSLSEMDWGLPHSIFLSELGAFPKPNRAKTSSLYGGRGA